MAFFFEFDLSRVLKCPDPGCGFIGLDLESWKYPYSDKDYFEHFSGTLDPERPFIKKRIDFIRSHRLGGTFAELGCGQGETSIAASRAGFEVWGVDESQNSIAFLSRNYPGVHWVCDRLEAFLERKDRFDVIALFHVLEHIPHPQLLIPLLRTGLKPGGLLVLEVPDVGGGYARWKGGNWGYWLNHHVNYFSTRSLKRLLEPLGFHLLQSEKQHHFSHPDGVFWKDALKSALAKAGFNNILRSVWQAP
jgi:2-polyprenyl-3-methyl-5-hydroxy-6-metoxy-1,4-benzoquinol methylase